MAGNAYYKNICLQKPNTQSCVGVKNVTINEPFFIGHFPQYPVMPGVLIVEALAQAAVHDNWMAPLFHGCEKAAKEMRGKDGSRKTIVQILDECKKDDKLSKSAHFEDGNKIRDGILKRAPEEMIKNAVQYTVKEQELEEKTAEMINAAGMSWTRFQSNCILRLCTSSY